MGFLAELGSATVQYVLMIAGAVGCACLGAAIGKSKKKKAK